MSAAVGMRMLIKKQSVPPFDSRCFQLFVVAVRAGMKNELPNGNGCKKRNRKLD